MSDAQRGPPNESHYAYAVKELLICSERFVAQLNDLTRDYGEADAEAWAYYRSGFLDVYYGWAPPPQEPGLLAIYEHWRQAHGRVLDGLERMQLITLRLAQLDQDHDVLAAKGCGCDDDTDSRNDAGSGH